MIKQSLTLRNKYGGKKLLSERVIKDSSEYLDYEYFCMIGKSFRNGIFPEFGKTSTMVPVEMVKVIIKPEEIRPINALSNDVKIMEYIVKHQLFQYINTHKIIIPEQSGFRSNHSCETPLNLVFAEWKENLLRKELTVVFLELKRAFETVYRGIVLKWFKSYLTGKKQKTIVGSAVLAERIIYIGLPQGTVLAAILFVKLDFLQLMLCCQPMDKAINKVQNDLNLIYHMVMPQQTLN